MYPLRHVIQGECARADSLHKKLSQFSSGYPLTLRLRRSALLGLASAKRCRALLAPRARPSRRQRVVQGAASRQVRVTLRRRGFRTGGWRASRSLRRISCSPGGGSATLRRGGRERAAHCLMAAVFRRRRSIWLCIMALSVSRAWAGKGVTDRQSVCEVRETPFRQADGLT